MGYTSEPSPIRRLSFSLSFGSGGFLVFFSCSSPFIQIPCWISCFHHRFMPNINHDHHFRLIPFKKSHLAGTVSRQCAGTQLWTSDSEPPETKKMRGNPLWTDHSYLAMENLHVWRRKSTWQMTMSIAFNRYVWIPGGYRVNHLNLH